MTLDYSKDRCKEKSKSLFTIEQQFTKFC